MFYSECSKSCNCDQKFSPVCGADNLTHYSACYAGCQNVTTADGVLKVSNGRERNKFEKLSLEERNCIFFRVDGFSFIRLYIRALYRIEHSCET